jgi:ATP-dependent DNA helicase RecG
MRVNVLDQPVQYLKGVGPKRATLLERLGIRTLDDLLHHFPRAWENRTATPPGRLPEDAPLVLRGEVKSVLRERKGPHLELFIAKMDVPLHGEVDAVWFKRPSFRYDVFSKVKTDVVPGTDLWLIGRGDPGLLKIRKINVDEYYPSGAEETAFHVGGLIPIYRTTTGLPEHFLRAAIAHAMQKAVGEIGEILPQDLIGKRELLTLAQAVEGIHRPKNAGELEAARRRLAYEELLLLELAWTLKNRQTRTIEKGFTYQVKRSLLTPFRAQMGFDFTRAQKRVVNEIFEDMQKNHPMTRLLQGDVGSGKTVVAIAALLLAVENGYQGAFMAPTEILAEQHMVTIRKFLRDLPVRAELLTSRVPKKTRERLVHKCRSGELDILIGTHALLEGDVEFKNLRLAVIDEQHRFGVRQRTTLRQKGPPLDLLVMTATPIPRTLSLALYGDLEVSTIDEMPPGRAPAKTFHVSEAEAFEAVRREVAAGHQVYIVYPIIEESTNLDLKAAMAQFERIQSQVFPDLRVALVHGKMPGKKKIEIMEEFSQGRKDILVATPVVEVGIDVSNATVMIIQNADRFGLASLHQLRGRIGRGKDASYCYLVADTKTPDARRRVNILCETNDGFRIGEEDLKIRGPGEALGTAQHGTVSLQVADLFKDSDLLASARTDAMDMLNRDKDLKSPEIRPLRQKLVERYQKKWQSIDLA